ncbi:ATP-binding protein [Salana multivorans]
MESMHWSIPADANGVAEARRAAATSLHPYLAAREYQVLQLLLSELVTNALVHGLPPITVTVLLHSRRVRVEVHDRGTQLPRLRATPVEGHDPTTRLPRLRAAEHGTSGGRGLALVEALADDWGIGFDGRGKLVWFEVARMPRPQQDHSPLVSATPL